MRSELSFLPGGSVRIHEGVWFSGIHIPKGWRYHIIQRITPLASQMLPPSGLNPASPVDLNRTW